MNLRAFYENNGVDYDALLQRLMGKESLVEKYIHIFLSDLTFSELAQAMEEKNYEAVGFRAHTLKGIAMNLNLEKLSLLCMDLIDSIRNDATDALAAQFALVKAEYVSIIEQLKS